MIGRQKRFSFDRHRIASKKFTNTAARVTPMKSAPKVFPRCRLGGERFWVEEHIVNWPELLGGMLYIFSASVTCSDADGYCSDADGYCSDADSYLPILGCCIEAMWSMSGSPNGSGNSWNL
jgi:hypothetical protein